MQQPFLVSYIQEIIEVRRLPTLVSDTDMLEWNYSLDMSSSLVCLWHTHYQCLLSIQHNV